VGETYHGTQDQERGPLLLERGLGFFAEGVVDQHFDRKARLGRLLRVAIGERSRTRYAFGVDENTALVYDAVERTISVEGLGAVTVLDTARAALPMPEPGPSDALSVSGVVMTVLTLGDRMRLTDGVVEVADFKRPIEQSDVPRAEPPTGDGLLYPNPLLRHFLTYELIDNTATEVHTRVRVQNGREAVMTFSKDDDTRGYLGSPPLSFVEAMTLIGVGVRVAPTPIDQSPRPTL
jgi:hypothetical protein